MPKSISKSAQLLDGLRLPAADVLDFRNRESSVVVANARGTLADVQQAVFVAIRERPQQHAANNTEEPVETNYTTRSASSLDSGRPPRPLMSFILEHPYRPSSWWFSRDEARNFGAAFNPLKRR
jgi:hypothetical protein